MQHHVRVLVPFRAGRFDSDRIGSRFVELLPGSVLMTAQERDLPGLMTVLQDGEQLLVFGSDLRERTEIVHRATGAAF